MKRRILSILLALVMALSLLPTAAMAKPGGKPSQTGTVDVQFRKVVTGLSPADVPKDTDSDDDDIKFEFTLIRVGNNDKKDFDFELEEDEEEDEYPYEDFDYSEETEEFTSKIEKKDMHVGETYTLTENVEYPEKGYNGPKECDLTLKAEPEENAKLTKKTDNSWEIVVYDSVTITAYNNYAPKQTYTLTYDVNGGTGAPASQTGSSSTGSYPFTVSNTKPTRGDLHFMGWADSYNATTAQYQPGDRITLYKENPTKTIYAVWGGHEDAGGDGFCDNGGECLHDHDGDGYCTEENCTHGDNCCPKPQQPAKPSENDVAIILGNAVEVKCTNTEVSHETKTYVLLSGGYTVGDVTYDKETGYYCDVTIKLARYVARYNEDLPGHTAAEGETDKKIRLNYWGSGDGFGWTPSPASVTFNVVCETPAPQPPAKPTDDELSRILTGNFVTVECISKNGHSDKSLSYGLLPGGYTIGGVTGNKTDGYCCNVTIKPATYVAKYNETLPGHTAVATTTDKTIVLEMGGTGWIVSSGAPVTFYVDCVSYTLTYDVNGGNNGGPEQVQNLSAQSGYHLNTTTKPTHVAEGNVPVVFIGWTAAKDTKIYTKDDTAPTCITTVDIEGNTTVYAAWGYDTNGDGKADVNQIPVYVYAKFENSADQQIKALPLNAPFSLKLNEHGWLTLGYVLVDGTVTKDTAVAELSKTNGFIRYDVNAAFDLSLVSSLSWTLTQADGADNYVENGTTCYHLDGVIPVYQVAYDANGGAGAPAAEQYLLPDTEHPLNSTTKPTHEKVNNVDVVFIGWMNSNNNEKVYVKGDAAPETIKKVDIVNQDVTVYAAWGADTNNNDIADVLETKYTVTYNDGVENKEVFEDQVYNDLLVGDDTPAFDGTPTRPGYRFVDWTPEWSETVTGDVTYTAQWRRSYHPTTPAETKPKLNKADHYAYVVGYPDGTVQPQGAITRAEVATIFFRLLSDETRDLYWTKDNAYTDIKAGDWFNNAVSTLSNAGIINGYPDGTFRPNAPITRAEMAKVIAMFAELDKDSEGFKDIAGHWAEAYIKLAAGNGWIAGYPDGTFRPDQYITRAETMTMINRVLERVPSEEEHLLSRRVMLTFPDNQPGDWYYIAVQEATNSHTYERSVSEKNGDEQWIKLIDNYDWTKLEF